MTYTVWRPMALQYNWPQGMSAQEWEAFNKSEGSTKAFERAQMQDCPGRYDHFTPTTHPPYSDALKNYGDYDWTFSSADGRAQLFVARAAMQECLTTRQLKVDVTVDGSAQTLIIPASAVCNIRDVYQGDLNVDGALDLVVFTGAEECTANNKPGITIKNCGDFFFFYNETTPDSASVTYHDNESLGFPCALPTAVVGQSQASSGCSAGSRVGGPGQSDGFFTRAANAVVDWLFDW